jgi:hypothetical protein
MYDLRSKNEPSTELPENPRRLNDEKDEPEEKHHTGHWLAIGLLAVAIAGLCWWGYPTLKQAPAVLAQFPAVQKSLDGINAQLAETESRFKHWSSSQQQLQERVADVEKTMASRIRAVRKQAQDLSDQVYQRVHAEVAAQNQATDTKIARLESLSQAERANVEKLQTELAALREQTAEQLQAVHAEMNREGANRDQQLVSLNEQAGRTAHDLDGLNKKLAVKRVDFEVTRNHSQQLTEDVSLGVTGTDVSHRRVTGWMWVMPDRRTIWLRGQGAQEPVVFYGSQDGKRRELVITNVAKNSVSGYLILPAEGTSNLSASVSKGD